MSARTNSKDGMEMVTLDTANLKERLNKVYGMIKTHPQNKLDQPGLFDYLWDLKEMALMAGKRKVDVPKAWLEDLEASQQQESRFH